MEQDDDVVGEIVLDEAYLQCPVCKDVYVRPRMYPCGHSCCEPCMIKMDQLKEETTIYHTPLYMCPCCRAESIYRWNTRPINHALSSICNLHSSHTPELSSTEEETSIPTDVNLRTLAVETRNHIALDLYEKLLPILFKAAGEGRRYVVITDSMVVRKVELVCDLLSHMLFTQHDVYKVLCTRNECQIIFSNDYTVLREYTNHPRQTTTTPIHLLDINAITNSLDSFTAMLEEEIQEEDQ